MPVPSSVSDLSSTASSNYPTGGEAVGTSLDDYLRSHAAIIRQVSDAKVDTTTLTSELALKASLTTLAASSGSSLVGFIQSGTGAVVTDVESKLRETISVKDFGAVGDGGTNDTTALLNFFNACVATGKPGHIPAGDYLVTPGVLVFDNGFTDKVWPNITTDGYDAVTFLRADATDAPLITISNGTATSITSNYWRGGCLGGITFDQNGKATASSQHGLSLRGVWGTKFGWMKSDNLGGSCVSIPQALYGGSNPDPYAVGFCEFDGIEANSCLRYALENQNWVGFNGNKIKNLRVVGNTLGGWYGLGAANTVDFVSAGPVSGWMFDDGCFSATTGGPSSRIKIGIAELDNVENGFRLNRITDLDIGSVRFIHRFNYGPNAALNYWPRKTIHAAAGTSPSVLNTKGWMFHRVEAGGAVSDLGDGIDLSSSGNVQRFNIDNLVADNGAIGVTSADLYSNIASTAFGVISKDQIPISDTRVIVGCKMAGAAGQVIPAAGYGTAAAKIPFDTLIYDRGGYWDTTNDWFVAPYARLYRVNVVFALATTVGTLVRIGVMQDIGGSLTRLAQTYQYQVNAGTQHYRLSEVVSVSAGGRIYIDASSATGATVVTSAGLSASVDFTVSIEAL